MRNNSLKLSYFLGLSMGLVIAIFVTVVFFSFNNVDLCKNKADIINENAKLKSEILEKNLEIEKLSKKIEDYSKDIIDKNSNEDSDKKSVILDIRQDMSNSDIADLIIENGIYKHKNDILMVMEILNFDRYRYCEVLGRYSYISSSYELNKSLKEIEKNQYAITEALYSNNLVKHKNSFMKLLYLFDINTKIKYGQKEFKKDSSLRDVCDALIC